MNFYVTLINKKVYKCNKQTYLKDKKVQVIEEVYNSLGSTGLFKLEKQPKNKPVETIPQQLTLFALDAMYITDTVEKEVSIEIKTPWMYVASAFSPNWMQHAREAIFSLFLHNKGPIKVFILTDTLGQIDMQPICDKFGSETHKVEYLNIESIFTKYITTNLNIDGRFTKYTLYRLFLPRLVGNEVKRILYIDGDALVVGDIRELYECDLKDNILAGVIDSNYFPWFKKIGFELGDIYINAGVTLMDMEKIRELNLMPIWFNMMNTKFYDTHDQDAFNITCKDKILPVDRKYNVSLSTTNHSDDPRVIHYAGNKPWYHPEKTKHTEYWVSNMESYMEAGLPKIPKIIHYCWLGGNKKPPIVEKCIKSWRKHNPTYKLIEWNEHTFDVNRFPYIYEAYKQKKYAFVTDYVRLLALTLYGGLYMDCDVEVLKPLDKFLIHRAFTGLETPKLWITATMGAEPEHPWIKYLLSYYNKAVFTPTPNTKTVTDMSKSWLKKQENGFVYLNHGVVIYPVEVFCPYDHINFVPKPTANSYCIHHFAGTWLGRTKF